MDSRRARLIFLGTAVLVFAIVYVWLVLAPMPNPSSAPARETAAPPFPTHQTVPLPLA
jgi:hypothetical protein